MREILQCEVPSIQKRLTGALTGASYRFVQRTQDNPDVPRSVKDEDLAYTITNEAKYTKMTLLKQLTYRGEDVIGGTPLGYVDTCLAGRCDSKTRVYTSGSRIHEYDIDARMKMLEGREQYTPQTHCSLRAEATTQEIKTSQRGIVNIDGVTFQAVKFVTKRPGTIICEVGRVALPATKGKETTLGQGEIVSIEINLADKFPDATVGGLERSASQQYCDRTRVFQATVHVIGGKILWGNASDVTNARIAGNIQSVAEFLSAKKSREDLIKKLEGDVAQARGEKTLAETEAARASVQLNDQRIIERTANEAALRAEQIGYRSGSTEAERQAALDARRKADEARALAQILEKSLQDKKDLVVIWNRRLAQAEEALRQALNRSGRSP